MIYLFIEVKVLGNWIGFFIKFYLFLFVVGIYYLLINVLVNILSIVFIVVIVFILLGSIMVIGIFNFCFCVCKVISFVNNIFILNGDIIIGIFLFLLFVFLGIL